MAKSNGFCHTFVGSPSATAPAHEGACRHRVRFTCNKEKPRPMDAAHIESPIKSERTTPHLLHAHFQSYRSSNLLRYTTVHLLSACRR